MSATTNIFVTPSTSLVLIKSLSSVTNVYLGSFQTLFSVTIRDTTGLSSILTSPVNISTIGTARFQDGSSYYPLDKPYGLVNLSLRNSNTWQVNHTSGKPPASAAANVQTLSTLSSFFTLASTAQKLVSTFIVENLTSPNSITITSPFIVSNLSTPGFVRMNDTLVVFDNVLLNKTLNVQHAVRIFGSTFVNDISPWDGQTIRVLSSVGVGGSVSVDTLIIRSTLTLFSTVQVSTLQVKQSTNDHSVFVALGTQVGGSLSSLGSLGVGFQTTVNSNALFTNDVSTLGGYVSTFNLNVRGHVSFLGNLSALSGPTAFTAFVSSFEEKSTFFVKLSTTLFSTLDVSGNFYTSSLVLNNYSSLANVSTVGLTLLGSASVNGNISTSQFESYQFMSIGGNLVTPASISSIGNTRFYSDITVLQNTRLATAYTSSSVGVGQTANILRSTFASYATVGQDYTTKNLIVNESTRIQGNVGVASNVFIYGDINVLGAPTVSSFFVESFLLQNLEILTSSPFTSFAVSSLHASTLLTYTTRITRPLPDYTIVSSTYASTTQFTEAIAENAVFDTVHTDSFFLGDRDALDVDSYPKAILNEKTHFAKGLSSLEVRTGNVQTEGEYVGNIIGNVAYLSNVPYVFPYISVNTAVGSSFTLSSIYTSSFTASTFVIPNYTEVQSTVITPYIVFESQGFSPRYDINQFLTLDAQNMVLNRNLYFNANTKKIGLFVSSPSYDLDVSGEIFASNIFYSSINLLVISTTGTAVYSTIQVSSSYVKNKVSYDGLGIRLLSRNQFTGDGYFEINDVVSTTSNLYGFFDCVEQSTILFNNALQINRRGRVGINQVNIQSGELIIPQHALSVNDTLTTEELYTSSLNLLQSLQTTSLVTPYYTINQSTSYSLNTFSSAKEKLVLNTCMTLKTDTTITNRYVGIHTLDPQCSLDVRGSAYFSTLQTFETTRLNYVAMASQEF
jgi:hypothetical protein